MRLSRPPLYPRHQPARACLATQGSVRLVSRRHCLYRVTQRSEVSAVWVRPVSPQASAWMRAQGCDARRVLLASGDQVAAFIRAQEAQVESASPRSQNNILPAPRRRADG